MNTKLPNIPPSIFSVMSRMATDHNAINLSQGFPNFESDPVLIKNVTKAMNSGYNQYAPMQGDIGLREIIVAKTEKLHCKKYNPKTEVTITAGATQAIFTAIAATISMGDEVLLFTPAYDCYAPTIELFGAKVIAIQLQAPYFKPDWELVKSKLTNNTRMIIINSPHNPSGMLFTAEDMLDLQNIVVANDLLLISDEVYEHIIFDGKQHESAARFSGLSERAFITASFGKTFHNTGWKMGYCLAPQHLMAEFQKVHQYNLFCVNHPFQKALATYMEDETTYLSLPKFYQEKRDYFITQLQDSRFKIIPSKGTYFQLLEYSEITSESDITFAEKLTKEFGLATIPTSVFNNNKEDFKQLRVCFAKTNETIDAACKILNSI